MDTDILLVIVSVLSFFFFVVTSMVAIRLALHFRRKKKAELDFSWLFLDKEAFSEFNALSKEFLIIIFLFLFGVVWYLIVGDAFRISMIFVLLALIQVLVIVYVVKKTMKIPKEVI